MDNSYCKVDPYMLMHFSGIKIGYKSKVLKKQNNTRGAHVHVFEKCIKYRYKQTTFLPLNVHVHFLVLIVESTTGKSVNKNYAGILFQNK